MTKLSAEAYAIVEGRHSDHLENKPVFFGHYWLNGSPSITAPNAACLDFHVGEGVEKLRVRLRYEQRDVLVLRTKPSERFCVPLRQHRSETLERLVENDEPSSQHQSAA